MRPKKKVTLQDVAAALGTSVVTVSNALSGREGVSEELRERAEKTAAELGYVYTPKRSRKTETGIRIALLAKEEGDRYRAVRKAAVAKGYEIKAGTPDETCRGLLLCGDFTEAELAAIRSRTKCPMAGIGFMSIRIDMDCVVSDAGHAGLERTRALIAQGKKRIAVVKSSPESPGRSRDQERIYGCTEALFYCAGHSIEEEPPAFAGVPALAAYLKGAGSGQQDPGKSLPDALLCLDSTDVAKVQDIEEVSANGITVTDCGREDTAEEAVVLVEILARRIRQQDAPEGVHFVREIL